MLDRLIARYCRWLEWAMALALGLMVILVFGNVVLRYGFNAGISVSDELSRWLFVWITFMGAVVALNDKAHLGTDMLVGKLGPRARKLCLAVTYGLMLFSSWLLFSGAWQQVQINWSSTSAVMEVSMSWFYASGMAFAVLGGVIILRDLWKLLSGQLGDDDLITIRESEEAALTSESYEKASKEAA